MAISNLDKYQTDIDNLLAESDSVSLSLHVQAFGRKKINEALCKQKGWSEEKSDKKLEALKSFGAAYQHWYSESLSLVKQLLPDRFADFKSLYEKPKTRKDITYSNYRLEDACQGLRVTSAGETKVDSSAAINLLEQQIAIVASAKKRFVSTLFDIRQLLQADLFDSELDSARELLKNKFFRAAGAIAGVVLEGHLKQVCKNHDIRVRSSTISPLNDALKAADIVDLTQFRFIQYLGDIRNNCDHRNPTEPSMEDVKALIEGVNKITKTLY